MTPKELRKKIVNQQRSRSKSKEPGPHAIANFLTTIGRGIFSSEEPEMTTAILKILRYTNITDLRNDARQLMMELREELAESDWEKYFKGL